MAASADLPERVHLVGIGGSGMIGLAECLADCGCSVTGSDTAGFEEAALLAALGIRVFGEHRPEHVSQAQLVVASDAISPRNCELLEARLRDLPIISRAQLLDRLGNMRQPIYVAGSHGKSSTTAMIAAVLEHAAASPSFLVGARLPRADGRRARIADGRYFVAEACEAFQNLAPLRPHLAVITNIDDDHLEHYQSQAALDEAFRAFADRTDPAGRVILNGDDAGVRRIRDRVTAPCTSFGFGADNDIAVASWSFDASGARFSLCIHGRDAGSIALPVPGRHMIANATACVAACLQIGLSFEQIAAGLAAFSGVARRWHDLGLVDGVRLIDDFAHHPTALRAGIETARACVPESGRLILAFQPQLFSRTGRLYREFAQTLVDCDHVALLEVDAAGEQDVAGAGSAMIAEELRRLGGSTTVFEDVDALVDALKRRAARDDVILFAGTGAIRRAPGRLRDLSAYKAGGMDYADIVPPPSRAIGARLRRRIARGVGLMPALRRGRPADVLARFQDHARRRPGLWAIDDGAVQLTYAALDAWSDRAAQALRSRGVAAGSVVGVRLPSSIDLIVILLALMKLRAAYLPLAPNLPAQRLGYMLETAGSGYLIAANFPEHPALPAVTPIALRALRAAMDALDTMPPQPFDAAAGAPGDIAYICFTSGSTGYPKGVAIARQSLAALMADITRRFGIGGTTRAAMNTSISFDVSMGEIWAALCGGGCLCATGSARPLVGEALAAFLRQSRITHLATTPSVLATVPQTALPDLTHIVAAGEALPQPLADAWSGGRQFFNAYGPTEATVYATAARCFPGTAVSIGRALGHTRTHVLDDALRPVPAGETGELCLGGPGVAAGYIAGAGQAGRADRFLSLELRPGRSEWIYRTGDLVRTEADGKLSYLGRMDDQIKILGNRIELEEIEHALRRIDGIEDAAVCARDTGGAQALVGFAVGRNRQPIDWGGVREALERWLPAPMIPARFLQVDGIPLTLSGKKDRRLLLEQHDDRDIRRLEYYPPRNAIEQRLAAAWRSALGLDFDIGVYDDFHALGGDSLRTLILVHEIEKEFRTMVPPGYFGRFTTITNTALQLGELLERSAAGEAPPPDFQAGYIYQQIRSFTADWSGTRKAAGGLILSSRDDAAEFELFVCIQYEEELRDLATHLGDRFRVHGMRSGHLVMPYTSENVARLAAHYTAEIAEIAPAGRLAIAGVCQGGTIARAMMPLLEARGLDARLLVLIEQARLTPYERDVAFFYSEGSFLNPHARFASGLARYDEIYGDRYSMDILPGPHGSFQRAPAVHDFARALIGRIEAAR